MENSIFYCLVERVRGRGREKWWDPPVFSPPPSKYNLSKLERIRVKSGKNIWTKLPPHLFYVTGFFFIFSFYFFFSFDFSIVTLAFFFSLVLPNGGFFFFSFFFFLIFIFIIFLGKHFWMISYAIFWNVNFHLYTILKKIYNVLLFILFKRDMMVNLYKPYFQPNQKVFHPFTFRLFQPNTNEEN